MPINLLRRKILQAIPLLPAFGIWGCGWSEKKENSTTQAHAEKQTATGNAALRHRAVSRVVDGMRTSDGAGVKLKRYIGTSGLEYLDPFLLLDEFSSNNPDDYIAGFPPHPHRGMETVTYVLEGRVAHSDSLGNSGVIEEGDAQWMTAGSGIIHSEMPAMENGLLRGLQLWVNLRAKDKMSHPKYRELKASAIPIWETENVTVRIIAGAFNGVNGAFKDIAGNPLYLDVMLAEGTTFSTEIPAFHNAFAYVLEGKGAFGRTATAIAKSSLALFEASANSESGETEVLSVDARAGGTRFILAAGAPLNEPVARGGPFVMNTQAEIHKAWQEYQNGTFIKEKPRIDERKG